MANAEKLLSPAAAAADAISKSVAEMEVTTGLVPGVDEALPDVKFPRLSVERRVLGHITDLVDTTAMGPRNTLKALTYALMRDRNTTSPRGGNPRLDVDGATTEQVAEAVLEHLNRLVDAGLVKERRDGSYAVTDAGHVELGS